MTAIILHFPSVAGVLRNSAAGPPGPYDFWFCLLHDMTPDQRQQIIADANRCGVINDRDAYIFRTSWPENRGT